MLSPKEIVENLTIELRKVPSVVALTLIGSQAREDALKATEYSDLEVFIITKDSKKEEVENALPNLLSKFGKVLFSFKHDIGFITIYDNLFRIETPVIKVSEIKSLFNRPKAQVVKILIDNTKGELISTLDSRPETIDFEKKFEDKVTNFWNWQIIGAQYFKKGEVYNTRAILNIHSSTLIKLFELLNDPNILLLETNKRVEQFLNDDQLRILADVTPDYDKLSIKRSLLRAMEIFPLVFKDIKNKYGYEYDESLESKVKPRVIDLLS